MNFDEYQAAAVATAIYPEEWSVIYPALGLGNEAGEVQGKIKKQLRDGILGEPATDEQKKELAKEIGDVLWYCAALARDLGINLDTIAQWNIQKLQDRQQRGVIGGSGDNR